MKRFKHVIANFLRRVAEKTSKREINRSSVLVDIKSVARGSVVLYNASEQFQFAYRLMIRENIFKAKELDKFIKRGDKRLKAKFYGR